MHAEDFEDRHFGRYANAWERSSSRAMHFLRTRRSEHWIMFLAGLVIGLILG